MALVGPGHDSQGNRLGLTALTAHYFLQRFLDVCNRSIGVLLSTCVRVMASFIPRAKVRTPKALKLEVQIVERKDLITEEDIQTWVSAGVSRLLSSATQQQRGRSGALRSQERQCL